MLLHQVRVKFMSTQKNLSGDIDDELRQRLDCRVFNFEVILGSSGGKHVKIQGSPICCVKELPRHLLICKISR